MGLLSKGKKSAKKEDNMSPKPEEGTPTPASEQSPGKPVIAQSQSAEDSSAATSDSGPPKAGPSALSAGTDSVGDDQRRGVPSGSNSKPKSNRKGKKPLSKEMADALVKISEAISGLSNNDAKRVLDMTVEDRLGHFVAAPAPNKQQAPKQPKGKGPKSVPNPNKKTPEYLALQERLDKLIRQVKSQPGGPEDGQSAEIKQMQADLKTLRNGGVVDGSESH